MTWIVVSDGGDDLAEHYGPFETEAAADEFEARLIAHLDEQAPEGPYDNGEGRGWQDWVWVTRLHPPEIK